MLLNYGLFCVQPTWRTTSTAETSLVEKDSTIILAMLLGKNHQIIKFPRCRNFIKQTRFCSLGIMVDRTVEEDGVVEEVTEGIAIAVQGHFRQSHLSLHL